MAARKHDLTVGELLDTVVGDLTARIEARAPAALADEPDAVHRLRTAVRRLRVVLAGFRGVLRAGPTRDLRDRLAALGAVLGEVRDLEVRAEQLVDAAEEAGADVVELLTDLRAEHDRAHRRATTWWHGAAGQELEAQLTVWQSDVPVRRAKAAEPAKRAAREVLRRQARRTVRLAGAPDLVGESEAGHELRKAGRRLRHLGDAVLEAGLLGVRTRRLADAGARVQTVLGDHRDARSLADHLRVGNGPEAVLEIADERAGAALADLPAALAELHEAYARWR